MTMFSSSLQTFIPCMSIRSQGAAGDRGEGETRVADRSMLWSESMRSFLGTHRPSRKATQHVPDGQTHAPDRYRIRSPGGASTTARLVFLDTPERGKPRAKLPRVCVRPHRCF